MCSFLFSRTASMLLALWLCLGAVERVEAHPAPFSFVDIRLESNSVEVTVVAHIWDIAYEYGFDNPDDLLDGTLIRQRAAELGKLLGERMVLVADGRRVGLDNWSEPVLLAERQSVRVRAQSAISGPAGHLKLSAELFPYDKDHQTFLNFYETELTAQAILGGEDQTYEYFVGTRQGRWAVLQKFIPAGVHHILIGPDHLLFLLGLLLLGGTTRQLLVLVTAFTLAHSITLSLSVLNIVTPPARLVEPIIALSIIYIGVDNLMSRGGKDVRVWIALVFGLIHGFGFAAVLREMGLPSGSLGWSLFSFNFGVEIGQLMVVILVAAMLSVIRTKSVAAAERIAVGGSIVVIAAGSFWFIERVFFSGGTV